MAISFLKKGISVKRMLHHKLAGEYKARGYDTMHASSLTSEDFCERKVWLLRTLGIQEPDEFIGTALRMTFDHGNEFNRMFTEEWMVDSVVGHWRCDACGQMHGVMRKPRRCVSCNAHSRALRYQEVRFFDPDLDASCGVDALLYYSAPKLLPIELKTIDKDQWKDLVMPKAEHRQRTALYLHMIANSDSHHKDRVDTTKAVILYKSKAFGVKDKEVANYPFRDAPFSPIKEFVVHAGETSIEEPIRRARVVKKCCEEGVAPYGSKACSSALCPMAKACPVVKECHSGSFPPIYKE